MTLDHITGWALIVLEVFELFFAYDSYRESAFSAQRDSWGRATYYLVKFYAEMVIAWIFLWFAIKLLS